MEAFIITYIAVLGLFIGSFVNVVGLRIPRGESIVTPPSHCPSCHQRLGIADLVPVWSYIFLRGRCRHCGVRISPQYAFIELLTALLFVYSYVQLGLQLELLTAWTFIAILVAITISDLHTMLIPNKIVFTGMVMLLLIRIFSHPLPYIDYAIGFLVGGGLFYIIAIVSKGGMGGGDIKLMALIGLVLGWQLTLITIALSAFIGLVISGILILIGKLKRKEPFPFGPSIAIAALIMYFYGESILDWYVHLF